MSGGQQQQLAIGRALIGNPDLLLLDEPSEGSSLDYRGIARVMQRINKDLGTTHPVRRAEPRHDHGDDPSACYVNGQGPHRGRAAVPGAGRPRCRQASPADLKRREQGDVPVAAQKYIRSGKRATADVEFKLLFVLVILRHQRRRLISLTVTTNPTAEWIAHQITDAFP